MRKGDRLRTIEVLIVGLMLLGPGFGGENETFEDGVGVSATVARFLSVCTLGTEYGVS